MFPSQEITRADRDERKLEATTLPHDPLLGLKAEEPFNLPLTAFCYLVRRLSVRSIGLYLCFTLTKSPSSAHSTVSFAITSSVPTMRL